MRKSDNYLDTRRASAKNGCCPFNLPLASPLFRMSILFLVIAFLQFLEPTSARSNEPLRISVAQTPLSLPFFVAERMGFFMEEGVSVEITNVLGGHRTMKDVLEGRSDLATSSESVVMFNSFKSNDFVVLATFVTSTDDVKIVSRKNSGVDDYEQLAGKKVGTILGAASHYYLDSLLMIHGIDPNLVRKIPLQPEEMYEALNKGEVDAVSIWEPHPYKILQSDPNIQRLPQSTIYRLTFNLIAHKAIISSRRDDLIKLLKALVKAEQFIEREPGKSKMVLRNQLQLDQAFIDWIWPSYHYRLSLDQSLLSTLEGEARWAIQEGYVDRVKTPNYLDFISSAPLRSANPSSVTIIE